MMIESLVLIEGKSVKKETLGDFSNECQTEQ
jgi:hypothetical protein